MIARVRLLILGCVLLNLGIIAAPESSAPMPALAPVNPTNSYLPKAPDYGEIRSFFLMDAHSGYVIAEKAATQHFAPASLTKLMTLFLVADALKAQRIALTDEVVVSENAWNTGGSRMFLPVNSHVTIQELIRGVAIASGNDATVALAEHLAGSEPAFVDLMNTMAQQLAMHDTHFANSSGLPDPANYSSAADLAKLARAFIQQFPEYYHWFNEKWLVFNNIKQFNRNRLLWRDSSVDGMKTGHTDEAGFCLVSSAERKGMRLIAVVMGAPDDELRTKQSLALLNYGFRFYETKKLYAPDAPVMRSRVYFGKEKEIQLGFIQGLYLTVPVGQYKKVQAKVLIDRAKMQAPIKRGVDCGTLKLTLGEQTLGEYPLVALRDNGRANIGWVIIDYIRLFFAKMFS